MQIRSDFTKEEIMNSSDSLALTCHPLGKIKMLGGFFWGIDKGELETGNVFNQDSLCAMQEILEDSCREIKLIVDLSNEQWRKESKDYRKAQETIEILQTKNAELEKELYRYRLEGCAGNDIIELQTAKQS